MDKPAAIEGDYVDLRFMPGLKVARISIEIPIEYSAMFIEMFSTPNKVSPVKVVVARLAVGAYAPAENGPSMNDGMDPSHNLPETHAEPAERSDKPRTYTRSQIAALKLRDQAFIDWLVEKYYVGQSDAYDQDALLKSVLGIKSKTELDLDGPKAVAFEKLLTDFDLRGMVR